MGSLSNPKAWVPYVNTKDCSQGFCSLYCPQWCYIIFPPPPPSPFEFTSDSSSPKLSPLVIAIIGILASAFLLVSYYTIISKYCGNATRREIDDVASEELEHNNHNPSFHDHEPWHVPITRGLDEALIKSITVCKYKKGVGLIEGTDCSVCLSEFEEDESLRLLPKCSHAFHVPCIDTWLKSHSNCPLCRANIFFVSASPSHLPPITTTDHHQAPQTEGTNENEAADHEQEDTERGINVAAEGEVLLMNNEIPNTTPFRAFSFSDLGNLQVSETIIEIADNEGYDQQFRRSVSMDHSIQSRVSVADIIDPFGAGSSKQSQEIGKSSHRNKLMNMHCNINPVSMKRSFTSGRFSVLNRQMRLRDTIFPL